MDHPAMGKAETPGNGNSYSISVPKRKPNKAAVDGSLGQSPAPTPPHTHK